MTPTVRHVSPLSSLSSNAPAYTRGSPPCESANLGHPTSDRFDRGYRAHVALDRRRDSKRELASRPQLGAPGGLVDGGDKPRVSKFGVKSGVRLDR